MQETFSIYLSYIIVLTQILLFLNSYNPIIFLWFINRKKKVWITSLCGIPDLYTLSPLAAMWFAST